MSKDRTNWQETLAILDDNLSIEGGVISNRFATTTKIVHFAEAYAQQLLAKKEGELSMKLKKQREIIHDTVIDHLPVSAFETVEDYQNFLKIILDASSPPTTDNTTE